VKSPDKGAPGETGAQGLLLLQNAKHLVEFHPFSDEPTVPQLAGVPGFKLTASLAGRCPLYP
jgi:hypothetical protein